jgi:hypothetical protein
MWARVVGVDGANVTPVAVQAVLHHVTIGDKLGDQPFTVVTGRVQFGERSEPAQQLRPVEGENLGANPISRRLVRLVLEAGDDAVIHADPREAGRIVLAGQIGGHNRQSRP